MRWGRSKQLAHRAYGQRRLDSEKVEETSDRGWSVAIKGEQCEAWGEG